MMNLNRPSVQTIVRVLAESAIPVSVGGTLAETTLATYTLPAGILGFNGTIRIAPKFSFNAATNYRYMRIKFGSIVNNQDNGASATAKTLAPIITVANRNSLSSQIVTPSFTPGVFSVNTNAWLTGTVDTSAPVTISITGQTTLETGFTPITTNMSGNGTTVTVIQTAHGLNTGEFIKAAGASTAGYNVDPVAITKVDANTFTYPGTGTGTPATAPTIQRYSTLTLEGYTIELLRGTN
jgi:hypothetical protein